MINFIDDPRKWRVSRSGNTIETGWPAEKSVIALCPLGHLSGALHEKWLENAKLICELYNATLPKEASPATAPAKLDQWRDHRSCPECGREVGIACRKPSCPQLQPYKKGAP